MKSVESWVFGPFELNPAERALLKSGQKVPLQPRTFDVLRYLVERAGQLVRRERLLLEIWEDSHVEDANLTNSIATLRRILGKDAIQTLPKFGYRLQLAVARKSYVSEVTLSLLAQGGDAMHGRTTASVLRARDLFWLCIAEQPECAEAWAWLARACRYLEKNHVERENNRRLAEAAFRRAFALDPDLPSAHQFYTTCQADRGHALHAMKRLLARVRRYPGDGYSYAGLVQVCRFCGLLDASLTAHTRALVLLPDVSTSVPHTHFARCDYPAVVESYAVEGGGVKGYLDAAAWACLGPRGHVEAELRRRLDSRAWPPIFEALLASLLHAIRGERAAVEAIIESQDLYEDPETALYFSRHLAHCGSTGKALGMLQRACEAGLSIPSMMDQDPWFESLRGSAEFLAMRDEAVGLASIAEGEFRDAGGCELLANSGVGSVARASRG